MSLIGALNIGKSALATQQAAIQVTSNNIANAGNADYTRQTTSIVANRDQRVREGVFQGTGVNLEAISRQLDESLQSRLRASISDEQSAEVAQQWLSRIEAMFNELSDEDLSTELSKFFNGWSNLANKPQDVALRQIVIQSGESVAKTLQSLRNGLTSLQVDLDSRADAQSNEASALAKQVADLNGQIVVNEAGGDAQANGLRDQRDAILRKLSELIDIKTIPMANGVVDVYVGSEPLVSGAESRGVALRKETIDGALVSTVTIKATDSAMKLNAGQLGALTTVRGHIDETIDQLDQLAGNLIFELNKLHSSGQGLEGFPAVLASNQADDSTVALNDERSGLAFAPTTGSFVLHVKNKQTGLTTSTLVQVDLDGAGGNDTTLTSLVNAIDAIADVSASDVGGRLQVTSDSANLEINFSQDSSGALAALGINNFFNGSKASDIEVRGQVKARPQLVAAARNGEKGDNQTAIAIAALESAALNALGGASLKESYQATVSGLGTAAASARNSAEATRVVKETLIAQREALSGVSLDEEAINLMRQQRAYQGAARIIAAVDEMMNTILALL